MSTIENGHETYMKRCLQLAEKGLGVTSPNPLVGAVLVYEGRIIGEGWHQQYGKAHAEVNCLLSVSEDQKQFIPKSTLYVNLEPCSHFGKTPPCASMIVENKIPKVVIGSVDSNQKVAGKGIQRLKDAGIEVITGILEKECRWLNRRFFTAQEKKRPYIFLKWAQSDEGYIAPKDKSRFQLSNASSQKLVHRMRAEEDAILIGYQTALNDNPQLNPRLWKNSGNLLTRIVLDLENNLPDDLKTFDNQQPTLIFNYHIEKKEGLNEWILINRKESLLPQLLQKLSSFNSLIVEGGAKTLQLFIDADMWDEAFVFKTPISIQEGIPAPLLKSAIHFQNFNLDLDVVNLQIHEHNEFYI